MEHLELILDGIADVEKIKIFIKKLTLKSSFKIANEYPDPFRMLSVLLSANDSDFPDWSHRIIYKCSVFEIDRFKKNDILIFLWKQNDEYRLEFFFGVDERITDSFLESWYEFAMYVNQIVNSKEFYFGIEPAADKETRYFTNQNKSWIT